MRWGVVSDVHGNLQALRAVLDAGRAAGVDGWLCAGDLVGYGARPNECVELLAGLDARCVAGNHEQMALGRLGDQRCSALAREALTWTQEVLGDDVRTWLAALPLTLDVPGVRMAHGSPGDVQEYVRSARRADSLLTEAGVAVLVLGHTHEPWLRRLGGDVVQRGRTGEATTVGSPSLLLNPGSVGQSRAVMADARFAVLDLAAGQVGLQAVDYNTTAARDDLLRAGLDPGSYHCRPQVLSRVRTRLQAVLS